MSRVIEPTLVRQAQNGDPQATTQVLNQCESLVRYLAYRKGSQDADTEDRQQEIRLQIWRKALPGWSEEKGNAFLSWAYWWGRAKRGVIFKSDQRRPKHVSVRPFAGGRGGDDKRIDGDDYSTCSPQQVLSESLRSAKTPQEKLEREEEVTYLRRAIGCLSPDERLIVTLRFFGDHSIREISEMTERGELSFECGPLSQTKVKTLETRAVAKLSKIVKFFIKDADPGSKKETFRVIKVRKVTYIDEA